MALAKAHVALAAGCGAWSGEADGRLWQAALRLHRHDGHTL